MTRFEQDVSDEESNSSSTSSSGDFRTPVRTDHKFTISQPLFSGFKELAALQGSGADKKQQRYEWQRAKELLFADVMDAYYLVLQNQKDVELLSATQDLLDDRLKELKDRVDLGRSRQSEMSTSMADMKLIESDLIEAKAAGKIARHLLEFYTGEDLEKRSLADEEIGDEIPSVTDWTQRARLRLDVQAAEQGYIVAQKRVMNARAGFFPEVYADANYYTRREGFQSDNEWDVLLTIDVPVFDVPQTLGDIKEAAARQEEQRLTMEGLRRRAELDIRDTYENWISSREIEKALAEADSASKENYKSLSDEYRLNLVNNLDVLDALRRYQEVARRYHDAYFRMKRNYWKLKVAMGEIADEEETVP